MMKKICLLALLLLGYASIAQTSVDYHVDVNTDITGTTTDLGSGNTTTRIGDLRFCCVQALSYLGSNFEHTVNIYFEVTGGTPSNTIVLEDQINILNLTSGTINFIGVGSGQGITYNRTAHFNATTFNSLMNFSEASNSNGTINVNFENITISEFYGDPSLFVAPSFSTTNHRSCIYMKSNKTSASSSNLYAKFKEVAFVNTLSDIYCYKLKKVTTENCTITKSSYSGLTNPVGVARNYAFLSNRDCDNLNNTGNVFDHTFFYTDVTYTNVKGFAYRDENTITTSLYQDNTFNNFRESPCFIANVNALEFRVNHFIDCASTGILFQNPVTTYTVDFNTFDRVVAPIHIDYTQQKNNLGIDFVGSNPFGYQIKNDHNIYSLNSSDPNFPVGSFVTIGPNCVGIDKEGKVVGYVNTYRIADGNMLGKKGAIVRGNDLLQTNNSQFYTGSSGCSLLTYSLSCLSFLNNNVTATISTSSFPSTTNKYVADFYLEQSYTTSPATSIYRYIGSSSEFLANNATGSVSASFTSLLPVAYGSKIAMTITSLGDGTQPAEGTFNPIYYTIQTPTCPTGVTITLPDDKCIDQPITLQAPLTTTVTCASSDFDYTWTFSDDESSSIDPNPTHVYNTVGTYTVDLSVIVTIDTYTCTALTSSTTINVTNDCCPSCLPSFKPIAGKKYVVSAWVSEYETKKSTFTLPQIKVLCSVPSGTATVTSSFGPYSAKGQVIDGWQRIDEVFTVPANATDFDVELINNATSGEDVFFDDIRIHPFDASFKSFVYDPVSMRFVAELDNNNYATFYEYDDEGKLTRVKKETEKKVMTVKETRTASPKQN
ncbi:MAG: PKD domain-containing protein [Bacteroidota bacterium]|nr:PKD domain-containing protein [Bacteroidota bacterium]